jgi:dihydrofolate synthase/folylpolyglutamate synthase
VVIAGTNGKGSTVAALQAILLKHGVSVGAYTSPHLLRFNERIQLDGEPVSDAALCQAFARVERARGAIALTYFEFTTLAALLCFDRFAPHICLLEVGLGGRLDAVNIIDADITVVTNIQLDHEAWLGGDRETIAVEKAGIFRAGTPAICAEREPPLNLEQIAVDKHALWMQQGDDFSLQQQDSGWAWRGIDADGNAVEFDSQAKLKLHPDAVSAAIQAAMLLLPQPSFDLVAMALESAQLSGRCQILEARGVTIVLDVAHNPAAASRLANVLEQTKTAGRTHIIFAMLADKRCAQFIDELELLVDGQCWLPQLQTARAQSAQQLADSLDSLQPQVIGSTGDAIEQALATMSKGDRLLVTGSFYTVAEALQALEKRGIKLE